MGLDWDNSCYGNQIIVNDNQKPMWHYLQLLNKNQKLIDNKIKLFQATKSKTICFGLVRTGRAGSDQNLQCTDTILHTYL